MARALARIILPSAPGAFRLWLALIVVIHHLTKLEFGQAPVRVFFALSGYWVYRVWTSRYEQTERPWLTFVISRWWRLAPVLVIASLLCVAVMVPMHHAFIPAMIADAPRQVFSAVFVLGYGQMATRALGPAWSLDIEMQFYLVAPLMIMAVRRTSAIVALFGAFMAYTAGMAIYPDLLLTSFLVPFTLGLVAAHHNWTVSSKVGTAGQALAVGLVVVAALSPWRGLLLGEAGWWANFNTVLMALCLPQALVSVQRRGGPHDQIMADQSYIVYLLHWPAVTVLYWAARPGDADYPAVLLGLTLATALLCWAVHRWIDRPLNRARARWVEGRRRAPLVVPVPGPAAALAPAPATKPDDIAPRFA